MGQPDRIIGTRVFGGYAITRKIGEGGMGAVYVAENLELQKKLAVKVLLPDRLASASAASRFLAEARAASAINHKNIINILDSSTLADGRHYILMEYLEGTTLRRYSRGIGPMPVDVVLAIMAQVCSGLQAAHDRGIVHRDLKPSNIFLAPQPDNPYFTKVLDFGIAKLDDPNLAGDIETKSHTVAGTPNYMAPEQARALRDVDHRADIYSIGAIVYELLTGQVPYKAGSIGDLTYKQASVRPPTVRELRGDIAPAWDALVMRAIALEPSVRTASVSDLAFQMIAATEHGEAIARATASMLFAPAAASASASPRLREPREGEPALRSITDSLGDGRPPMALGSDNFSARHRLEDTRAATPQALARSPSSASHPLADATSRGGFAAPSHHKSYVGLPPGSPESPTTLGMSASQVPVQLTVQRPTPWAKVTAGVILVAASTAVLLVLLTNKDRAEQRPAAEPLPASIESERAPTETADETAPDDHPRHPSVAPLTDADAGVIATPDAAAPAPIPVAGRTDKSGRTDKTDKGRRRKTGNGTRERKGDRTSGEKTAGEKTSDDDDLFGTRK